MREGKRGQVTIFIILAIIIVASVLTFFLYAKPTFLSKEGTRIGFDGCVQDSLELAIYELEKNGGFVEPEFSYTHEGEEISYLCYTNEYYKTCTVQVPFLSSQIDNQLEIIMRDKVDKCYSDSIEELKSQGYEVTAGRVDYDVLLETGIVRMEIKAPTVVGSQSFTKFDVKLTSPVYDMAMMATSLLQFEATFGDTDLNTMSQYYPEYKITKMKMGDGTTIYSIESKIFGDKLQFASRSLVFPAGYDL
ncbi:hypothetical protein KAS08_01780 [Candidatus Pacearchaeota archaeon]|nr:hypothetical protein [Candidatus Pacearchaeota archaeon]